MKVGILTFHDIYNPGAFFQALGTVSLLKAMGHEPIIIDYTSPPHRVCIIRILSHSWRIWFRPRVVFEVMGRSGAFKKAQKEILPLTPFLDSREEVERLRFEAVLIGADVVWDYRQPNLGQDPIYFGKNLNAERIISFAASCGSVPSTSHPPEYVISGLQKMSSISVRDENTQTMVHKYSGRDSKLICDPAFHFMVDPENLPKPREKDYIVVYMMPQFVTAELIKEVKAYAKKKKLKTVAVCYRQHWTDANRICIGPMEWLGYLSNATYVVTNTFHGTVFSIKLGARFVSVMNDAIRLKTQTMVDRLSVLDRFWEAGMSLEDILESDWPVEQVHKQIENWVGEAKCFLSNALNCHE